MKDYSEQNLLDMQPAARLEGSVECLGMTFPNDEERRKYFLEKLREKLLDPEFREIEGFPIGKDEDILALSDPPYYTACPNPFIEDFIRHFGKLNYSNEPYSREPFAADVTEGKYHQIYKLHPYPTKVPHLAIMRFILHYTEPYDVVLDGFCGTGMTGVAAQLCGDKATVESLGYRVDQDGTIYQGGTDEVGKTFWKPFSKLGVRLSVLNDLSPAATFISCNYNTPMDLKDFEREAMHIFKAVESECGWMFETLHTDGKTKGSINYTVWSDVFICPECTMEVVFWEVAVDKAVGKVLDEFPCPHCNAQLTKRRMDRAWVTRFDGAINQTIRQSRQVPVLINYSVGKSRYEKKPDKHDLVLIKRTERVTSENWFPTRAIQSGDKTADPFSVGITHCHHFYSTRNLHYLAAYRSKCSKQSHLFCLTRVASQITKMYRFTYQNGVWGAGGGPLSGTLYIPSLNKELRIGRQILQSIKDQVITRLSRGSPFSYLITTQSSTDLSSVPDGSINYIFIDPPFGGNLMYSELNFLWEIWLKILTNNSSEAIENKTQCKDLSKYQRLITSCFKEYYRVLKNGRWMTVEFHNSKNSVWAAIQEALQQAGFIIADVRTLDKKKGTFNQAAGGSSVKQDLIISCYKSNDGLEYRFKLTAGTEDGAWDFVQTHLKQLPVFVPRDNQAEVIAERQNYLLFDRMVAFHVQRRVTVPLSAAEFYAGLEQRFSQRDGMYFLPDQVAEYDKKRMTVQEVLQLQKSLLKEFEEYRTSSQKRLKVFRLEAVRAGFKKSWQERDYATIIAVARKIPESVLQEDPKLLMWYEQALTRTGEDA